MSLVKDEYRTIVSGAGWIERRDRGRIRFAGRDVSSFLQALVTNDVATLTAGRGVYAAYLTPQGRMLAELQIHRRPDDVIATLPSAGAGPLTSRFDQLVFSEDVQVEDVSSQLLEWMVVGRGAVAALAAGFEFDQASLAALQELSHVVWSAGFIARAGDALLPSFTIIAPADQAVEVVSRLEGSGVVPISTPLLEALRIEAGRPLFGADMREDTIPLEAGLLDRAISTTKGCYVGQEVVIRILHRGGGRVARRLLTFSIDSSGLPAPGTELIADHRNVGMLTSVAEAPTGDGVIALGYAQRELAEPGRSFEVAGWPGGRALATGFAR